MTGTTRDAKLHYGVGNEHDPGDPFGRSELVLGADGRARLEHHRLGSRRAWTGRVEATTFERLWSALERAGFPNVPPHPIPGGATIRKLKVEECGTERVAHVAWHAAKNLPGYDEAFAMLDALIRQLSEDTVRHVPVLQMQLVTDVSRES